MRALELVVWDEDAIRKEYLREVATPLEDWFLTGRETSEGRVRAKILQSTLKELSEGVMLFLSPVLHPIFSDYISHCRSCRRPGTLCLSTTSSLWIPLRPEIHSLQFILSIFRHLCCSISAIDIVTSTQEAI